MGHCKLQNTQPNGRTLFCVCFPKHFNPQQWSMFNFPLWQDCSIKHERLREKTNWSAVTVIKILLIYVLGNGEENTLIAIRDGRIRCRDQPWSWSPSQILRGKLFHPNLNNISTFPNDFNITMVLCLQVNTIFILCTHIIASIITVIFYLLLRSPTRSTKLQYKNKLRRPKQYLDPHWKVTQE